MHSYAQQAAKVVHSKDTHRFMENGFDLDLTYITPRLIVMGFPYGGRFQVYIYTYIHTYIHTYVYTHIYMRIRLGSNIHHP